MTAEIPASITKLERKKPRILTEKENLEKMGFRPVGNPQPQIPPPTDNADREGQERLFESMTLWILWG